MKILFVCSGNSVFGISPIVSNQGKSLESQGVCVEYFPIIGKGLWKYLWAIPKLKKHLKSHRYDIIHAHYSLSAIIATFAGANPIVVSLMGSDAYCKKFIKMIIKLLDNLFWNATIVKSKRMALHLALKNAYVIPNGVDFNRFVFTEKEKAKRMVGFTKSKNIIFVANKNREEKNYELAKMSVEQLNNYDLELHEIYDGIADDITPYYWAADILLLTSYHEGSPNCIKEAMACGLPIIATDVGDVKQIIHNTAGCFLVSFEIEDVVEKIKIALDFNGRTDGRENVAWLESKNIANKIIKIYRNILND